jgi:hypothetical protein
MPVSRTSVSSFAGCSPSDYRNVENGSVRLDAGDSRDGRQRDSVANPFPRLKRVGHGRGLHAHFRTALCGTLRVPLCSTAAARPDSCRRPIGPPPRECGPHHGTGDRRSPAHSPGEGESMATFGLTSATTTPPSSLPTLSNAPTYGEPLSEKFRIGRFLRPPQGSVVPGAGEVKAALPRTNGAAKNSNKAGLG